MLICLSFCQLSLQSGHSLFQSSNDLRLIILPSCRRQLLSQSGHLASRSRLR